MGEIPESEKREGFALDRIITKVLGWFGLTSGIGIVGLGAWWFAYCLISYYLKRAEYGIEASYGIHSIYLEQLFIESELGIIIMAAGVVVITIKKAAEAYFSSSLKDDNQKE